ncbi:MAG: hypothetical protein JWL94_929 [Microbacteriaceae bacterium]|jgi:flagellar hook-associated protein 2|nr:hypothetical protein [Microbacteriaceae bacterium]HEV7956246.1 flagellar filament capping protein FliD [Marisediminicola sp.]
MGLAVDGLVSGLDTTSLINSLMQLEALPQTILKTKVSTSQSMISALQGLNAKIAALGELARTTAQPGALDLYTATTSSTTATATARAEASAGQMNVVVASLAQAQVAVSAAMSTWPENPPALTIVASDGTRTAVTAASTSLDDVVLAINGAGAGVNATKVSTGDGKYRLQFTSAETGADASFGIESTVAGGTQRNVLDPAAGAAMIKTAQNASLKLWAGTSAEQTITSPTNTFAELLPGVDVTVTAVSSDPITVTVARDDTKINNVAKDFVGALNGVFALISTKSVVTDSTDSSGRTRMSGGPFTGDSTVRATNQQLLTAASMPVDGRSPSEIGVSITKTGEIEFDAARFATALKEDPAKVERVLQELATRVADAATEASDKYDGMITAKITGQESMVKNFTTQIAEWDGRLEARRSTLERTYAAMEVQLSALNSQASWLTSQMAAPTGAGE